MSVEKTEKGALPDPEGLKPSEVDSYLGLKLELAKLRSFLSEQSNADASEKDRFCHDLFRQIWRWMKQAGLKP